MEHDGRPKSILLKRAPPPGVKPAPRKRKGSSEREQLKSELLGLESELAKAVERVVLIERSIARVKRKLGMP